ncbi:MAG: cysteine desulfurase [Proteobacteria bacterium]|nr:cysteine desulfurase [Pseudomonadota bacterium]MBU1687506.1 cysteine desulfurase [Pseudomonadota bacterium]
MNRIYFDNNATTQVAPEVRTAILPTLDENFGNPSSAHRIGERARQIVDLAREQVAELLSTQPARILFTSGGSESNNIAIFSAARAYPNRKHIISSVVEHPSVQAPLAFLANQGYEIELLPVDHQGNLDLDRLTTSIRPGETLMISLMGANNETGVIWPLATIGKICRKNKVLFHSDVVQMVGKEPLDPTQINADYLSIAGHKLHGPKGVGALYASRTAPVFPLVLGASQEHGKRAGTENTPGIAGLGAASALAAQHLTTYRQEVALLRDRLESKILTALPDALINGRDSDRLANTTNICFKHCSSAGLIQELDERGIAVSGHSACHSGDLNPSPVLSAMQVPETHLHGALRISLCRDNTRAEVEHFLELLPEIVAKSRRNFAA